MSADLPCVNRSPLQRGYWLSPAPLAPGDAATRPGLRWIRCRCANVRRFRAHIASRVSLPRHRASAIPHAFVSPESKLVSLLTNQPNLSVSPVARELLLTEDKIGPRDGAGKTCVVAMSGGVDSAVTALVMRERGDKVIGINLRLFSPGDAEHRANPCCGIPALNDARMTCARIGVPFYALNMEAEFGEAVVERFVDDYAAGRTPNPCLECNRHVKFRHLVERARALGADCLATGHYARIEPGDPA